MRKLVSYMINAITALFTRAGTMSDSDECTPDKELTVEEIKTNIDKMKGLIRAQEVVKSNEQMTAVAWSLSSMFGETRRANRFNQ